MDGLKYNLTLDATSFEATASRAGAIIRRMSSDFDKSAVSAARAQDAIHKIGSSFKSTVVTLGALRFALMDLDDFLLSFPKSVARAGGEFQRLQTMMEGLSKSTDELTKKFEGLRDMSSVINFSKSAPFEISALADAFIKLKSAGLDPTAGSMSALVNSVSKFGGTSETMKRAAVAIQQMSGKGVISMEELRQQLGEAIPNAMELMARGMGISMAELTDRVSKGTVLSRSALAKMFAQMELDSRGAAERMMQTLPGAISQLKTEFELFQKTVSDQGFTTTLTGFIKEISSFLSSEDGKAFAQSLGKGLNDLTESAIVLARWLAQNIDLIKNLGIALLSIYGGSKAGGAFSNVRAMFAEQQQAQKAMVDEAKRGRDREIADLQKKGTALEKANALAQANAQRAREEQARLNREQIDSFRNYQNKQAEGLAALRRERLADFQQEQQRLRSLQVETARLRAVQIPDGIRPDTNPLNSQQRFRPAANFIPFTEVARGLQGDRLQALEQEIAQSRKLIEEKRKLVAQTSELARSRAGDTVALRSNLAASEEAVNKTRQAIDANNRLIASKSGIVNVAGQAGGALLGFGRSLLAGLGWAAAFALAVEGIIYVFGKFTEAARVAEEQQNRFDRARKGQALDDDPEKFKNEIGALRTSITTLQQERARAVTGLSRTGGESFRLQIQDIDQKIASATQKIKQATELANNANKSVASRQSIQTASSIISDLESQLQTELNASDIFKKYQEKGLVAATETDPLKKAKLQKEFREMGADLRAREFAIWKQLSEARLQGIGTLDQKTQDAAKKGIADKTLTLANQLADVRSTQEFGGSKKGDKAAAPTQSSFEAFIEARRISIAKLQNDAEAVADGYISAYDTYKKASDVVLASNLKNDKGAPLSPADLGLAIDLQAIEYQKTFAKKGVSELAATYEQLKEEQRRTTEALAGNDSTPRLTALDKLLAKLGPASDMIDAELRRQGSSWATWTGMLRGAASVASGNDFLIQLRDQALSLADDLETDEVARERRKTDARIAEIDKRLKAELRFFDAMDNVVGEDLERKERLERAAAENKRMLEKSFEIKTQGPIAQLAQDWGNAMKSLRSASTNWANSFVDQLVEGKLKFADFAKSILQDIAKIAIKNSLSGSIGGLLEGAVGGIGSLLGLNGAKGGQSARINPVTGAMLVEMTPGAGNVVDAVTGGNGEGGGLMSTLTKMFSDIGNTFQSLLASAGSAFSGGGGFISSIASIFGFANGGIMTEFGAVPLRQYANGGIAKSPQLAMFGEGSTPEAFVPLPDGRRIPVAMSARAGSAQGGANVSFNVINQTSQQVSARETGRKFDGRSMILDVVLEAVSSPGSFRDNMKGAMG